MTPSQHLAASKYVSTFSTIFQTQGIKKFWAWNLESLISGTGSVVTLDRIRCYPVLEKQHFLGTRMVSCKYLVCFICHSLETKTSFFIFYVYVYLHLLIKFYIYSNYYYLDLQYATNIISICQGLCRQVFEFLWLHFYGEYHFVTQEQTRSNLFTNYLKTYLRTYLYQNTSP